MKSIVIFLISMFCIATLTYSSLSYKKTCPNELITHKSNFCALFAEAASCYCESSGLPNDYCQDVLKIHQRMMAVFGSLKTSCELQPYTSTQACMDNWNCYLEGGVDSHGQSCSTTKNACL